jgi:hypothetical protein
LVRTDMMNPGWRDVGKHQVAPNFRMQEIAKHTGDPSQTLTI